MTKLESIHLVTRDSKLKGYWKQFYGDRVTETYQEWEVVITKIKDKKPVTLTKHFMGHLAKEDVIDILKMRYKDLVEAEHEEL